MQQVLTSFSVIISLLGDELPEYKVFTNYYSKLADTIPACNLSHYFVSENVISLTDHEEITKPTTPSHTAGQLLLNKVLHTLKEQKNVHCFNKMLSIMEHHGDGSTHTLSQEIKSKVLQINSGQQGRLQLHTISVCIVYGFVDLLEVMLPHPATLEAAPLQNSVLNELIPEGQFVGCVYTAHVLCTDL